MHARFAAAALAALTFSIAPPASAQDIVGEWVLRPDLGTGPEQSAFAGRPDEPTPGAHGGMGGRGGMGGGGMSGGRGGGMSGAGMSDQDRARMQAAARRAREAPARLTITRDGPTFAFADEAGRAWTLTTDGRKHVRLTGDGEISSKARVDGVALVVEEALGGPVKLEYRYVPETEGDVRRLRVVVSMTGGPQARGGRSGAPRALVRVYELEPAPAAW